MVKRGSQKTKNYSPKDQIENADIAWAKQSYVRFPGEMFAPVAKSFDSDETKLDYDLLSRMVNAKGGKRYTMLHTNPYSKFSDSDREERAIVIPGAENLESFVGDDSKRAMVVAQHNSEENKVEGYHVWKKTKKTPKRVYSKQFEEDVAGYQDALSIALNDDEPGVAVNVLNELSKKYHLQQRFVPAEGFGKAEDGISFSRKKTLEAELAIGLVVAVLAGILFFNSTITGAVIGISQSSKVLIAVGIAVGVVLFGLSRLVQKSF